jgi:multisubunit Na+/H+ antiporter MnhF subunit
MVTDFAIAIVLLGFIGVVFAMNHGIDIVLPR